MRPAWGRAHERGEGQSLSTQTLPDLASQAKPSASQVCRPINDLFCLISLLPLSLAAKRALTHTMGQKIPGASQPGPSTGLETHELEGVSARQSQLDLSRVVTCQVVEGVPTPPPA